jgi:hypothetical protein
MLTVKKIRKYTVPRYPKGEYFKKKNSQASKFLTTGILSASVMGMLDSCIIEPGLTGEVAPPPLITEDSAKKIINQVFLDRGIALREDAEHLFIHNGRNSIKINLDGYNDSLKTGYEYVSRPEDSIIANKDFNQFSSTPNSNIKFIEQKFQSEEEQLEDIIIDFIDSLISRGNI